jgi:hypothetical protein
MNLRMTDHLKSRLIERSIDIDHIKSAIHSPDKLSHSFGGRIVVTKKCSEKIIEVVYLRDEFWGKLNYVILTAYYLKNHENNI